MRFHRVLAVLVPCLFSGVSVAQQAVLFTLKGDSPGDQLGVAQAGLDDVDLDGVPDFAIGSPGDSVRHVRIFSGATGGFLQSLTGSSPGDGFGSELASIADVDGDGARELAIAATLGGYVRLHTFGPASTLWTWIGPVSKLADAGDVNADGTPDIVALSSGLPSQVHLLSGLDGSVLSAFTAPGQWRFLDAGGDVDGDGVPDVILGNPFWPSSNYPATSPGRVEVYSGASGQLIRSHVGDGVISIWLGWGVAMLGDIDQDGRADYAAGWPWDMPLADPGHALVWSGASGAVIKDLTSGVWGYGAGVFAAGDVDGDGLTDLGVVDENGATKTLRVLSSSNWAELDAMSVASTFGFTNADIFRLAVLADIDGDPNLELLVGYPSAIPEGQAIVVTPCSEPTTYCVAAPNSQTPSGSYISWAGNTSVAANKFTLVATGAVVGQSALFIYGQQPAQVPFGDGFLCLDGSAGVFRILPGLVVVPFIQYPIDFSAPQFSQGPGALLPGSTWNFQLWYRDTAAAQSGFNLSNALRVQFCQ